MPLPSANSNNANHPKTTQSSTVPSPTVTSSEGFIAEKMAIHQSKLKKLSALEITDFQAIKQLNIEYIICCALYCKPPKKKSIN